MSNQTDIWIGLVEVTQIPGTGSEMFGDSLAKGGYINAVAYAVSSDEFMSKTKPYIESYGVKVTKIESIAKLKDVLRLKSIEPTLSLAVKTLQRGDDVALGTLHTYPNDG